MIMNKNNNKHKMIWYNKEWTFWANWQIGNNSNNKLIIIKKTVHIWLED